jgi:2-polyprenyl-6-methoxyphenol hydroxylase-like FAD-dependent oxidoreductase
MREVTGWNDIKITRWDYLTSHTVSAGVRRVVFVLKSVSMQPQILMVETLSKSRCFVAGDAAHTHGPSGGQGLNMSMQDSVRVCRCFTLIISLNLV